MRVFKLVLLTILLGVCYFGLFACGKQTKDINMEEELSCTVLIHTSKVDGVGIIIDSFENEMIVASPFHIVSEWDTDSFLTFWDDSKIPAEFVGGSKDKDIAFLRIETTSDISSVWKIKSDEVKEKLSEDTVMKGQIIHAYDLLDANKCFEGSVSEVRTFLYDLNQSMMLLKIENHEGMSGTPVFNDNSEIIGMIIAGNGSDAGALSTADIINEYDRLSISAGNR